MLQLRSAAIADIRDGRDDAFADSVDVGKHVIVPEPQDDVTLRLEPRRSLCVARGVAGLAVAAAVNLDDQAQGGAGEIGDERSDRDLPAKM
jgi:hypothetical protein